MTHGFIVFIIWFSFKNDSYYTHLAIIKTLNPWVKYVYNIPNQVYESFLIGKSYYKDNKSMGQVSLYRLKSTPLEKKFSGASWYKHTWPMPTPWYQYVLVPSEIGRLCASKSWGCPHDSYPVTHTPSDRGGIDLWAVSPKNWFLQPTHRVTPTRNLQILFWRTYTPIWKPT